MSHISRIWQPWSWTSLSCSLSARRALADFHEELARRELREDHIIPSPFNRDVPNAVANAVAEQAKREGSAVADPGSRGYAPGDTQEFGTIGS